MLFVDDAIGDIQALACASAYIFGREERVENSITYAFRNAGAGVTYANDNPGFGGCGADGDFSAAFLIVFDSMRSIQDDIQKYLI